MEINESARGASRAPNVTRIPIMVLGLSLSTVIVAINAKLLERARSLVSRGERL